MYDTILLNIKSKKLVTEYFNQIKKRDKYDALRATKVKQKYEFKDL